ncbi:MULTISPECIES: DUF6586 family protein [unclassified Moraxella]|uniref:DUF6586 family protein n=1 Tax=unclassified Moraxella TaxID=2685852 RepID=UPI003AF5D546
MANRVARYHADRTNQKLYFVRVYCQLAEQTQDPQLVQAHIESAVMHLHGGYLALLQEIARYYQLNQTQPSLDSIAHALEARTQISPEVLRLTKLLQTDFLGEIERAWQQVLYKPTPKDDVLTDSTADSLRLPVVDVMATGVMPTSSHGSTISTDLLRQWRQDLLAVIEALRAGMVEF